MNGRTSKTIILIRETVKEVEGLYLPGFRGVNQQRWRGRDPSSDFKGKSGLFCLPLKHLEIQKHQHENQDPILLSTLLHGSESWKMTKAISHKLEVFQNRCLRRILHIFWPNTISNYELRKITRTESITQLVQRRRWRWSVDVLRMSPTALPRVVLRWPLMAAEREVAQKKPGGGRWKER